MGLVSLHKVKITDIRNKRNKNNQCILRVAPIDRTLWLWLLGFHPNKESFLTVGLCEPVWKLGLRKGFGPMVGIKMKMVTFLGHESREGCDIW